MDAQDINTPLDDYFGEQVESRAIFDALREIIEALDGVTMRVTKSQVAFRRRVAFGWVWMPEQYQRRPAAPLVLTVGLRRRNASPRWKEVVEPARGRFTHHLEVYSAADLDEEVRGWLREAWEGAE